MSYMICCVPKCTVRYGQGVALHTFPNPTNELERFRKWIYNIGGEIMGKDNMYIFKNRRVCHNHFEEVYCYSNNRLSKLAVPTQFDDHHPFIPSTSGVAMNEITIDSPRTVITGSYKDITCVAGTSTAAYTFENQLEAHSTITGNTERATDITCVAGTSTAAYTFENQLEAHSTITGNTERATGLCNKRKSLTCEEMSLKTTVKKLKTKLAKSKRLQKSYKLRLALARKYARSEVFEVLSKSMSNSAKTFLKMQLLQSTKKNKGRRYTLNEKILALSIYKPSPKAYRFLSGICALPSPKTLQKLLQKLDLSAGFNEIIFKNLKKRVAEMPKHHRFCSLLFDEMALSSGLSYDKGNDQVLGFVDDGKKRQKQYTYHALVFMIRGVIKKFKQPLVYTFCAATTKTFDLKSLIKEILLKIQECGLEVIATICDQGASNRAAINSLIADTRAEHLKNNKEPIDGCFEINNKKIFCLYDPPHLLKGVRNNLITKDLYYVMDGQPHIAKWSHIINFYKRSPSFEGVQLTPKLTANHVIPSLIPKMKVKHCTQVFSSSVGAAMGFMADSGKLPQECKETARILIFFDKLFDSVNGSFSQVQGGKIYRAAVTPSSPHHKLWDVSLKVLKSMRYINSKGEKKKVPSLSSWIQTIQCFTSIVKFFKEKGITSLLLRNFNQDPIENFFGAIRAHGQANTMPNAAAFQAAYKTLLINNMTSPHSIGANCEKDDGTSLKLLRGFFKSAEGNKKKAEEIEIDENHFNISPINTEELISSGDVIKIEKCAAIGYCSGWIVRNIKKTISKNCIQCKSDLETDKMQKFHEFIKIKEYANKGWLCYPTREVFDTFAQIENITITILKDICESKQILNYVKLIVTVLINFTFLKCEKHKDEIKLYIINKCSMFCIHNYLKIINNILCGKKDTFNSNDINQRLAYANRNKKKK